MGRILTTLGVIDNDRTAVNRDVSFTLTQSSVYFAVTSSGVVTLANDVSGLTPGTVLSATVSVSSNLVISIGLKWQCMAKHRYYQNINKHLFLDDLYTSKYISFI